jgi:transcriptional regulator with XRE-family HTH domain
VRKDNLLLRARSISPTLSTMSKQKIDRPNPFGAHLARMNIPASSGDVAEALGVTRSYVGMLARGQSTPSLALAFKIEDWSAGAVPVAAWREVVS